MKRIHHITTLALLTSLIAACGSDAKNPDPANPSELIPQTYAISQCGGFESKSTFSAPAPGAPASYCDAELLSWRYEKATGKLVLSNTRASLNCCGDRTMKIEEKDGVYLVTETDEPQAIVTGSGPTKARCGCMCVFDLSVEAQSIPEAEIEVKLARDVTDSGSAAQALWSGKLNLAAGAGTVVLDKNPIGLDSSGVCMPKL
jgi:hypothetical protein